MATLQPRYLPKGALARSFMGLDLCNILEKEQSAVGLFPQTEEEAAWEDRELAAVSAFCPALVAVTLQLHHLAAASCAPEWPGPAPAQQKGCRRSWWWRREGWAAHALSQASREEAGTAGYTGSKPTSLRLPNRWDFTPFKGAKHCC